MLQALWSLDSALIEWKSLPFNERESARKTSQKLDSTLLQKETRRQYHNANKKMILNAFGSPPIEKDTTTF
jgi:hypothetical protein